MTCAYQLAFFSQKLPKETLALVRYTLYDEEGKVSSVETIEYADTREERDTFQGQVLASLECGVDVTIMSKKGLNDFPYLREVLEQ